MKYLILLRHAKSSWKDLSLSDHDRPLNKRGKKAAPLIGKRLSEKEIQPRRVISSTAKRAIKTARNVIAELDIEIPIQLNRSLYHAGPQQMLEIASETDDAVQSLMLVGHNPGITELANKLLLDSHYFNNIPTAGMATIKLDISCWKELLNSSLQGGLKDYDYPKNKSGTID